MKEKRIPIILLLASLVAITFLLIKVYAQDNYNIPGWIKNSARWWSEGQTSDSEFVGAMQYLINQKIIKIGNTPESKVDSIILPFITTDKRTYHMGEEIKIAGSGFQDGTVGLLVGDDRFSMFLDKSQNFFSNSLVSELADMIKYPIPDPMIQEDQWKKMNFSAYGIVLKTNVKVNSLGTWEVTLKTSDLAIGHYELRAGQKIYNGYNLLSNSSQTFLLKTAKIDFFIES